MYDSHADVLLLSIPNVIPDHYQARLAHAALPGYRAVEPGAGRGAQRRMVWRAFTIHRPEQAEPTLLLCRCLRWGTMPARARCPRAATPSTTRRATTRTSPRSTPLRAPCALSCLRARSPDRAAVLYHAWDSCHTLRARRGPAGTIAALSKPVLTLQWRRPRRAQGQRQSPFLWRAKFPPGSDHYNPIIIYLDPLVAARRGNISINFTAAKFPPGEIQPSDTTHFEVTWGDGVTEGGSSGSPLIDAATNRVMGVLTGGFSSCDQPKSPDYYGRLSTARAPGRPGAPALFFDARAPDCAPGKRRAAASPVRTRPTACSVPRLSAPAAGTAQHRRAHRRLAAAGRRPGQRVSPDAQPRL